MICKLLEDPTRSVFMAHDSCQPSMWTWEIMPQISQTYCKLVLCSLFSTDLPQKIYNSYLYSTYWNMQNLWCYIVHSQISSCLPLLFSFIQSLFVFHPQNILKSSKVTTTSWHASVFQINNTHPCYKLYMCLYVLATFGKGDNYVCIWG